MLVIWLAIKSPNTHHDRCSDLHKTIKSSENVPEKKTAMMQKLFTFHHLVRSSDQIRVAAKTPELSFFHHAGPGHWDRDTKNNVGWEGEAVEEIKEG